VVFHDFRAKEQRGAKILYKWQAGRRGGQKNCSAGRQKDGERMEREELMVGGGMCGVCMYDERLEMIFIYLIIWIVIY
jgi:hypothetical protein